MALPFPSQSSPPTKAAANTFLTPENQNLHSNPNHAREHQMSPLIRPKLSRSPSPHTSPTSLLHSPLPQTPIPPRLASSQLILDASSPFHKRSVSQPSHPPPFLALPPPMLGRARSSCGVVVLAEAREKIEGVVGGKVKRETSEEKRKREWAEEVLFGEGGGGKVKG